MKIVINKCYGGFGLSHEAIMRYGEIKGISIYPIVEIRELKSFKDRDRKYKLYDPDTYGEEPFIIYYTTAPLNSDGTYSAENWISEYDFERNDPALIQTIEELGEKANGSCAKLKIVEIPDGVDYEIEEYDGREHIAESHRVWN
jgi:hypothetical protein